MVSTYVECLIIFVPNNLVYSSLNIVVFGFVDVTSFAVSTATIGHPCTSFPAASCKVPLSPILKLPALVYCSSELPLSLVFFTTKKPSPLRAKS